MSDTIERSQTHATFVVERIYPAPVATVWHALSDNNARDEWFTGGPDFTVQEKSHEFRVGGRATETGQWHNGPASRFESTYTDIVDEHRIVFAYDMWVNDQHLSTSLTTIVVERDGDGTRLTYTEQGVHFDGLDSVEGREEGTRGLLDNLATSSPGRAEPMHGPNAAPTEQPRPVPTDRAPARLLAAPISPPSSRTLAYTNSGGCAAQSTPTRSTAG